MKKKFLAVLTCLLMFGIVTSAGAADLTTIFFEKSADSTQICPAEMATGDYIRFRALFIGDDGLLADTFESVAIETCDVEISLDTTKSTSGISGSDLLISWDGADVEPGDLTWPNDLPLSTNPSADGYLEFAISVDNVRTVGTVVLNLVIDNGSDNESTSITFDIVAPAANGYVVRTGAVTENGSAVFPYSIAMPDVGEEVADDTGNYYTGIPLLPSQAVTVNVFAVYDCDEGRIFTDNLPAGADSVVIAGYHDAIDDERDVRFVVDSASATLTDGYVSKDFTITDLKIPELLAATVGYEIEDDSCPPVYDQDLDEDSDIGILQYESLDVIFEDGIKLEWEADATVTREVGPYPGDTIDGADGNGIKLTPETIFGTVSNDDSFHGVGEMVEIMMVGLPLNAGPDHEAGVVSDGIIASGDLITDTLVSPLDAYMLLDDPTAQPAEFKAVCGTDKFMYGALLGWDAYDNPAPVARGYGAYFTVNDGDLNVRNFYGSSNYYIYTYFRNQAFVPFAIENDVRGSITNVYISDVSGAEYDLVTPVEGSGVDFIGDVYASQLTMTLDYTDTDAGDFNGIIRATGGTVTQTYSLEKAVYTSPMTGSIPMTITAYTKTAQMDIVAGTPALYGIDSEVTFDVNTALPEETQGLFVLEGANGAMMITGTAIVETITAGAVDAIELQYPGLVANVVVGHLNDNDLIAVSNMYKAYDEFGNEVSWSLVDLDNFIAGTTSTSWALPIAEDSVVYESLTLTQYYDIDLLGVPAGGSGSFQLEALSGTPQGDPITINPRVVRTGEFMPVLTAESQIDVPVLVYLADQAGNRVAPPDQTVYDLDITTDNDSNQLTDQDEGPASNVTVDIESLYAGEVVLVDAAESLGRDGIVGMTSQGNGILGFTNYDLQLESDYDYEAPDIDIEEIEDGLCTIIVHVTDNVAVDIEETIASIELYDLELNKVLDGEDNASEITGVADGTGATITISVANIVADDGDPQGAYELHITAIDEQGNDDDETIVLVDVDVCLVPPPECVDVNPFYLEQGESGTVVITALNTAFTGSETVTACSGVTVGTISATSDTTLSVALTVAATATAGDCALEVDLGDEIISCLDFAIVEPTCEITASPSIIRSGWLLPRLAIVSIVGNEDCDEFTFANSGVAFDDAGMIPLLPIPIFGTIVVPTLVWPGTEGEVTVTVDGEHTDTIDVEVGILP